MEMMNEKINLEIFTDKSNTFKGPDGKEYESYADLRRAELADLRYFKHDEFGVRRKIALTPEQIEAEVARYVAPKL